MGGRSRVGGIPSAPGWGCEEWEMKKRKLKRQSPRSPRQRHYASRAGKKDPEYLDKNNNKNKQMN